MNKKTRSEWGSYEDFVIFAEYQKHVELKYKTIFGEHRFFCHIDGGQFATSTTREEARRLSVEDYCNEQCAKLPWRPDYDLSTEAGCRAAIKTNGYRIEAKDGDYSMMRYPLFVRLGTSNGKGFGEIEDENWPSFELWQEAAQWAIDNPAGENNE